MLTNTVQDLLEESFAAENAMQAMFAEMRALMNWYIFCSEYGIDDYTGQRWSNLYYAGGGGARTGDASENGIPLTDSMKEKIKENIKVKQNGSDADEDTENNFFEILWKAYGETIREEDYYFLTHHDITVTIDDETFQSEAYNFPGSVGLHRGIGDKLYIYFSQRMFTDKRFKFGYFTTGFGLFGSRITYPMNKEQSVLHEFGHAYHYYNW